MGHLIGLISDGTAHDGSKSAPSSQPLITLPTPISVSNGAPLSGELDEMSAEDNRFEAMLTDPYLSQICSHLAVCQRNGW